MPVEVKSRWGAPASGAKINGIVLCGGLNMGCVHKLPSNCRRRAKRPFSIAAFGFIRQAWMQVLVGGLGQMGKVQALVYY